MRKTVLMVIDGLRGDTPVAQWMPSLARVADNACVFSAHRGVFPSATRVSSASLSTGCWPATHGLPGNSIALRDGDGYINVSAGSAEFAQQFRAARGQVLDVPTLADRLGERMLIVSNSSAGAAHMQDPNKRARLMHRSGSWFPGGVPSTGTEGLEITYDGTGDAVATQRFCEALVHTPAALSLLWICEPDHSQHVNALGGPDHRAMLAGSDRMVAQVAATVARLRDAGEEVLFIVTSDHGHETTDEVIDVTGALVDAGFKAALESKELVVASSGMGGLIYAMDESAEFVTRLGDWMNAQLWCHQCWSGPRLGEVGQRATQGIVAAFSMARRDVPNAHGVMGLAHTMKDPFMPYDGAGQGQHGGFGPYEGSPLLLVDGGGFARGVRTDASRIIDLAPTVLDYFGESSAGMDGQPLVR